MKHKLDWATMQLRLSYYWECLNDSWVRRCLLLPLQGVVDFKEFEDGVYHLRHQPAPGLRHEGDAARKMHIASSGQLCMHILLKKCLFLEEPHEANVTWELLFRAICHHIWSATMQHSRFTFAIWRRLHPSHGPCTLAAYEHARFWEASP